MELILEDYCSLYFSANCLKPVLNLKLGPSCDGEILRSKQKKEMKIKDLLKFFLLLEEGRGSLDHIRSPSSLSAQLLAFFTA